MLRAPHRSGHSCPARRPSRVLASLGAVFAAASLAAACSGTGGSAGSGSSAEAGASALSSVASGGSAGGSAALPGLPAFAHVYVIVLENKDYATLVGASDAPYLTSLGEQYAVAANYSGVAHPSQPNYIALFSGSTQGVADDGNHDVSAPNLADQLEANGRTWAVFAQGYPGGCDTAAAGPSVADGPGESGPYVRKHDPAISFTSISGNPARCARITSLERFDPAAADFELIVPNLCNDMHDCSVARGDAFLRAFVPAITSSPAFARSVLFITTDEGTDGSGSGGGHVATLVISPLVKPGFVSPAAYDHYSLLRTIEDAWGLGCLAESCHAIPMREFWP